MEKKPVSGAIQGIKGIGWIPDTSGISVKFFTEEIAL
jgi:hypothetical protein